MTTTILNTTAVGLDMATDRLVVSSTKVMTNGDTIFNVVGDVQLLSLVSECVTANGVAATTIQYSFTTALAQTTAISGVSASLANAIAGTTVTYVGDAFATAPVVTPSGVALNTTTRGTRVPDGALTLVVATGPTTGTWKHYLRYEPLQQGAYVTAV